MGMGCCGLDEIMMGPQPSKLNNTVKNTAISNNLIRFMISIFYALKISLINALPNDIRQLRLNESEVFGMN